TSEDLETSEDLVDVLMAASSIPLLFPPRLLAGEGCWIDGGLVRNTPIQAAIQLGAREIYAVLVEPDSFMTCPNSLMQLISRLLEIMLDHSARSGIAHVNQYNQILELSSLNGNAASDWCMLDSPRAYEVEIRQDQEVVRPQPVRLFIIKPQHQILGSLLEFDPPTSRWLMKRGYEDTIRSCIAV
ncbi:MAG: patatin-like phospholipase family protein, partial [Candidatus Obscuribacterales bacterium]|nr:patatin-like phospholipase family protein [Candidatus Obscuribacterales bacterium]